MIILSLDIEINRTIDDIEVLIHRPDYEKAQEAIDSIDSDSLTEKIKFRFKILKIKLQRLTVFTFEDTITSDDLTSISELNDAELLGEAINEHIYRIVFIGNIHETKKLVDKYRNSIQDLTKPETKGIFSLLLGVVEVTFGNAREAISHTKQSLEIRKTDGKPLYIAQCYFNLVEMYTSVKEFDTALEVAIKGAKIIRTLNNPMYHASFVHGVFRCYINLGDLTNAQLMADEISEIYEKNSDITALEIVHFYTQATLLSKGTRLKDKFLAQDLLAKIVYKDFIPFPILQPAIYLYCELLILELKALPEEEIIIDLQKSIARLLKLAKTTNNIPSLIEALILDGKMHLLWGTLTKQKIY